MNRVWTGFEQGLNRVWTEFEQGLNRVWTGFEQGLNRVLTEFEQSLNRVFKGAFWKTLKIWFLKWQPTRPHGTYSALLSVIIVITVCVIYLCDLISPEATLVSTFFHETVPFKELKNMISHETVPFGWAQQSKLSKKTNIFKKT